MTGSEHVVVGMSGGVDSSVAAALLHERGYQVTGIALRFTGEGEDAPTHETCCSTHDLQDARRVAVSLGIPFHVVEAEDAFEDRVIDYFCRAYADGRTPNPCVACNRGVKFAKLVELARMVGADRVGTGHYARVAHSGGGRHVLKRGADREKDESYFLYRLTDRQLAMSLFPLGEQGKERTREMARERGLPVSEKSSTQDICFVGDRDYRDFLEERHPACREPGPIVDRSGRELGQHSGIVDYTVGQRKGLGIAAPEPLYVLRLEPEANRVVVGTPEELRCRRVQVRDVNWAGRQPPEEPLRAAVKMRYREEERPATVRPRPEGGVEIELDEPRPAPAPGQSAVFYDGDIVLGGGIIE
ncbi:MAG: tRNA 2-thiouridine(34) synthase MnmA [Planctomycetota bacterium]